MKVLITGGAGFVGRHFTKALIDLGAEVTVVDPVIAGTGGINPINTNWFFGSPLDFKNFNFVNQDCREFFGLSNVNDYDVVIHLAAIVGGRLVIENNPMAVVEDLEIDAAFWRWAIEAKDTHIISFSSSAAYPISLQTVLDHRPLSEKDIDLDKSIGIPDLTYGWAKLTSEYVGKLAHSKHGIKVACYRPFSGYGEDQDLSYPFPAIMKRALEAESKGNFVVWGSGLQERDFIHISDLVQNVLSSYKFIVDGSGVNLGTGIATNFKTLASNTLSILGKNLLVNGMSEMPEGVFSRVADTTLSIKEYGMTTSIDLNFGIKRALEYRSKL